MSDNKTFPNGFESWHETHYEIVQHLTETIDNSGSLANCRQEQQGHGGLYELAEELTDKFELQHQDRVWDGDFFDTIEAWLKAEETKHFQTLKHS